MLCKDLRLGSLKFDFSFLIKIKVIRLKLLRIKKRFAAFNKIFSFQIS